MEEEIGRTYSYSCGCEFHMQKPFEGVIEPFTCPAHNEQYITIASDRMYTTDEEGDIIEYG